MARIDNPILSLRVRAFGRSVARWDTAITLSTLWLAVCVFILLFGVEFAPYRPTSIDLTHRLAPPAFAGGTWSHFLGTDDLGRDVLSRLIYATRISLLVAVIGVPLGAVIGALIGFLAAYMRGLVDETVTMLVDAQAALPYMIVALSVIAFLGNNVVLLMIIIGSYGWERYARLSRSLSMSLLERGFVVAAQTYGVSGVPLFVRHILPNALGIFFVNMTITFAEIMLLESSLSFLGLGFQPPVASLGNMIGLGREYMLSAWWVAVFPGTVICLTALSASLIGDGLRDRFDPSAREAAR
ncbi:ABC transporter permease [Phyllobacterium chamaecytisi]|uniref:ABC transporter permease n=1 Tax=Phyllobacterium chamaecytisi TaxID=2876082 RepID=UPI001CD01337|nr:ABC transporter permease [Phyllobacterium sp. KW56]MBZ9602991.1 ABC transporter permease [Phyllobacterium sp. KW56]